MKRTGAQAIWEALVAEGIETVEQLTQLRELGCSRGQGFYFARPLGAEELLDRLGVARFEPSDDGVLEAEAERGLDVVGTGEVGIANTTAAGGSLATGVAISGSER